jgi:hypothetical protein
MNEIKHKWQKTDYTCGAAAVAMILGISEEEAAKLAGTRRTGTFILGAQRALATSGRPAHVIHADRIPLSTIGWALEAQSQRWPLYLSLEFTDKRYYRSGRTKKLKRRHACVLHRGQLFDPGEFETLHVDTLGHLSDGGEVFLNGYIILETE